MNVEKRVPRISFFSILRIVSDRTSFENIFFIRFTRKSKKRQFIIFDCGWWLGMSQHFIRTGKDDDKPNKAQQTK